MARKNENGLTDQQQLFCDYYLADKDMNAKQACIKAGYSPKTAEQQASRLLKENKAVIAYIDARLSELTETLQISQEDVLRDLMELRDMCMGRKKMAQGVIADGKVIDLEVTKVDVQGAKGSLELLGKYLKMFTDKVEHCGHLELRQLLDEIDGKDTGLPDASNVPD